MRKFLTLLLGIMISASAGITITLATNDDVTFLDEVLKATEDFNGNYDGTADELAKMADSDGLPFENLYLYMYQNVVEGPKKEALKELASRTSYTSSELEKIVFEGNIEPILTHEDKVAVRDEAADTDVASLLGGTELSADVRDFVQKYYDEYYVNKGTDMDAKTDSQTTKTALTQSEVTDEYNYLVGLYNDEYSFQSENRRLLYEAMAAEMFVNGDIGDSAGIDLLYDLNLINSVLFNTTIDFPNRDTSSAAVTLSSVNEIMLASEDVTTLSDDLVLSDGSVSNNSVSDDSAVMLASESSSGSSSCSEDSDLRDALDAFEESQSEQPPSEGGESDDSESPSDSESYSSSGGGSSDVTSNGGDDEESDAVEEFHNILSGLSGAPGDWTRMLPCNEIFCIKVNFVKETDEAEVADYEKTDNCIACHIKYINERMDETLAKSLTPSKVSMNYFEDATCKNGTSFDIGLHFFVNFLPITRDKGDETADAAAQAVSDFRTGLEQESGVSDSESLTGKSKAEEACEAAINQAALSGSSSALTDAMAKCNSASAAIDAAIAERVAKFQYLSKAESAYPIYEQMSSELYSMLLYLDGLRSALGESIEPLNSLISKPYCS